MAGRTDRKVVFVCEHGALRSRIAAAYFNAASPQGWTALSAGITPQADVSPRLGPLMAGTGVERHVDAEPPRVLTLLAGARIIAIDADVPGAETWRTDNPTTDEGRAPSAMRMPISRVRCATVYEITA